MIGFFKNLNKEKFNKKMLEKILIKLKMKDQ